MYTSTHTLAVSSFFVRVYGAYLATVTRHAAPTEIDQTLWPGPHLEITLRKICHAVQLILRRD